MSPVTDPTTTTSSSSSSSSTAASSTAEQLSLLRAPLDALPSLVASFASTYRALAATSTSQFLPTPITALPTGHETGRFLALDLGGTNLRVARVLLQGANRFEIEVARTWAIPAHLKSGAAELLFKWVAQRIAEVVRGCGGFGGEGEEVVELGVTFSFPMEQTSHASAKLMPMGKGFTFPTTNDLSTLLHNAYSALLKVSPTPLPALRITAITNDSVATLLSAAYTHTSPSSVTAAGVIAGTGTNATCLLPRALLRRPSDAKAASASSHVLVNTEWSIGGTKAAFARFVTTWDEQIDRDNEKPGFQPFEEMVGGRYLGEIVRRAALDALGPSLLPPHLVPQKLKTPYGVATKLCADVEGAEDPASLLRAYFRGEGVAGNKQEEEEREEAARRVWTDENVRAFRDICDAVATRAAAMVAAATVGLLQVGELLEREETLVVGYTGTVMERNYRFRERTQEFLDQLAGSGRVKLVEAVEGGIVGAAVLAGMVKSGAT